MLPFPKCHIYGIAQYGALRLASFTQHNVYDPLCCVNLRHSGLFAGVVGYGMFIHSPADGLLRCFQALVMVSRAALNTHGQHFV